MDRGVKATGMQAKCQQAKGDAQQACLRGYAVASSSRRSSAPWRSLLQSIVLAATVWIWACILAPVLCAATPQETGSAQPTKSAMVTRISSEITLDGSLDEPVWGTAPKIGDLTQRIPQTGQPPTERTEVTLLYDANNLYIGVMAYDSEPQRITSTLMERDANIMSDDRIAIVLDTYHDQSNAFYFATNPAGALRDGLVFANGQGNLDWNAIWEVQTRRTEQGWSAEFAIPFKSLNFPSEQTVWGFNILRNIQRKLEDDRWSGARVEFPSFWQVSEAGEITGLEGLTQGMGLDIRPFVGGRWLRTGATEDNPVHNTVTGKPGLDLFYNLTSSLKLSATANTDFGETEVDARQINLTRFSLFFPEKRSFFLEDVGVFSFASTGVRQPGGVPSTGADVRPFFSRQIGLLSGEEVPIDFGLKLTGKIGRTDIGVLDVRTRDLPIVPEKNFFVGRVKQNFLQQSYIGAIYTEGHPALSIAGRTYGADVRLATSRFLGGSRNLVLNAYGLRSANEGNSDRDLSYGVSVAYPNDKYEAQVVWRDIPENFRPALGFVQRRNVRLLRIGGSFSPRPRDFLGIQKMFHDVYYKRFTRLDNGQVESWDLHATLWDWHFQSGDSLHSFLEPNIIFERLFDTFEIFPGVILPVGEYRFTRWRGHLMSASKRKLQGRINVSIGNFWGGHAETVQTSLSYKIPPRFTISFDTNQTFARLPQGNFVARIFTSRVNYAASPFLTFSNLIQYDNRSRNLGWQSRVRWILQPGNDLFLVFNQGWIQDTAGGYRFSAKDSKVSTKFQYTFRF